MASNETTRAAGAAGNVFTVRGLGFAYGGRAAGKGGAAAGGRGTRLFDGLDLDIREGVVTTLIGANGSGKSTLFNLLTKNLKPQAGSIFLRAGDVSALRLKDFAKLVAIVHQRNSAPSCPRAPAGRNASPSAARAPTRSPRTPQASRSRPRSSS